VNDWLDMRLDAGPTGCAQDDNRYSAVCQILLVLEIGIGRDQYCEARRFRSLKKLTILQCGQPRS
jgi:hypothetical protein